MQEFTDATREVVGYLRLAHESDPNEMSEAIDQFLNVTPQEIIDNLSPGQISMMLAVMGDFSETDPFNFDGRPMQFFSGFDGAFEFDAGEWTDPPSPGLNPSEHVILSHVKSGVPGEEHGDAMTAATLVAASISSFFCMSNTMMLVFDTNMLSPTPEQNKVIDEAIAQMREEGRGPTEEEMEWAYELRDSMKKVEALMFMFYTRKTPLAPWESHMVVNATYSRTEKAIVFDNMVWMTLTTDSEGPDELSLTHGMGGRISAVLDQIPEMMERVYDPSTGDLVKGFNPYYVAMSESLRTGMVCYALDPEKESLRSIASIAQDRLGKTRREMLEDFEAEIDKQMEESDSFTRDIVLSVRFMNENVFAGGGDTHRPKPPTAIWNS